MLQKVSGDSYLRYQHYFNLKPISRITKPIIGMFVLIPNMNMKFMLWTLMNAWICCTGKMTVYLNFITVLWELALFTCYRRFLGFVHVPKISKLFQFKDYFTNY